jgi:hypothetical protein
MFLLDRLSERVSIPSDAPSRRWSRFAAAWFGSAGFVAPIAIVGSVWIQNTFIARGALRIGGPTIVGTIIRLGAAAVFAGVVGGIVWHLLVERLGRRFVRVKGAVVGFVTSVLAMPPFLFVEFLVLSPKDHTIASALITAVYFGALSVFIVGWLTIPLGVIAGYSLGSIRLAE